MTVREKDFRERLRTGLRELCGADRVPDVLLAVSGGADSMALLHASQALLASGQLSRIAVAHLDHGLRGDAGRTDRALVESFSSSLGIAGYSRSIEAGVLDRDADGSLEAAARRARYQFLCETAVSLKMRLVATAHHESDQAETILHNLIRGTGLRGLQGIAPSRAMNDRVTLIRPMLTIDQSTILSYVEEQGIPFREDESNTDPRFTRNRIRQQLLPLLTESFNPQAVRHIASAGTRINDALELFDQVAAQALDESLIDCQPNIARLHRSVLVRIPEALLRHLLTLIWQRLDWPRKRMSSRHWCELAEKIASVEPARVSLPDGVQLHVQNDLVRLERRNPSRPEKTQAENPENG